MSIKRHIFCISPLNENTCFHMTLTYALFNLRYRENTSYLGRESPQHVPTPMEEPELNFCLGSQLPCYVSAATLSFKVPKETGRRWAGTKDSGIVSQKGLRKGKLHHSVERVRASPEGMDGWDHRGRQLFKDEGAEKSREMEIGGRGIQIEHLPHG